MEPSILKKYLMILLRADDEVYYEKFEHFFDEALQHVSFEHFFDEALQHVSFEHFFIILTVFLMSLSLIHPSQNICSFDLINCKKYLIYNVLKNKIYKQK
jgi:hypothetical protein